MPETDAAAPAKAKPAALRKGALVKVNRAAYDASLEAARFTFTRAPLRK